MDEEEKPETKVQPAENETETQTEGEILVKKLNTETPPEEPIVEGIPITRVPAAEDTLNFPKEEATPPPVFPPLTPEAKEENPPCDPATMSCDEMRDHVLELSNKRSPYIESIKKLDEIKKVIPSEHMDKAYDDLVTKKQAIDDEIYGIFEKFTVCTTKPAESKPEEKVE